MASIRVDIASPAERYVALYSGKAKVIHAVSQDGLKVQFPGAVLNRFVTHDGVFGTFDVHFDQDNKLMSIERIG